MQAPGAGRRSGLDRHGYSSSEIRACGRGAINASLIIKDLGLDGLNVEGVPQGNALKIEVRNGEAATNLALLKENLEGNVSE
jgi:hypothetical protein